MEEKTNDILWGVFTNLRLVDRFWFQQLRHSKTVWHSFADSWIVTHNLEGKTHSRIHSWKVADFKVRILVPGKPVKLGT